jgi:hypothetical protein
MSRCHTRLAGVLGVFIVFQSVMAGAPKKRQAAAAQGNTAGQAIDVATPYCDVFYPYHYDLKSGKVNGILSPTSNDTQKNTFLDLKQGTSDPIEADGSFTDPGYPILGDPEKHFYSDGSDLVRLIGRLSLPGPTAACPDAEAPATPTPDTSLEYFLVHVVHWQEKGGVYSYDAAKSEWYVFNRSDKKEAHRQFPFTFHPLVSSDLRMLSNRVFFLAIHLGPVKSAADYAAFRAAVKINYKVSVTKVEPANIQDLQALYGVIGLGTAPSAAGRAPSVTRTPEENQRLADYKALLKSATLVGVYGAARLTGLENLPVQITAAMDATLTKDGTNNRDPYQNKGFWDQLASAGEQATPAKPAAKAPKGAPAGSPPPPQATACTTQKKDSGECKESVTVQDEKLYWWDVSVGVPFKGINELQFNSGSLSPKTVSKKTAYGFLLLAPWKEDIVTPASLGIPHILMGLPLTGKVFDYPFVGLGETVNFAKIPGMGKGIGKFIPNLSARFYAGLVESKTFGPAPAGGGAVPFKWVGKLQYGIEFSIRDVASKLSGSNAASSNASKTSN